MPQQVPIPQLPPIDCTNVNFATTPPPSSQRPRRRARPWQNPPQVELWPGRRFRNVDRQGLLTDRSCGPAEPVNQEYRDLVSGLLKYREYEAVGEAEATAVEAADSLFPPHASDEKSGASSSNLGTASSCSSGSKPADDFSCPSSGSKGVRSSAFRGFKGTASSCSSGSRLGDDFKTWSGSEASSTILISRRRSSFEASNPALLSSRRSELEQLLEASEISSRRRSEISSRDLERLYEASQSSSRRHSAFLQPPNPDLAGTEVSVVPHLEEEEEDSAVLALQRARSMSAALETVTLEERCEALASMDLEDRSATLEQMNESERAVVVAGMPDEVKVETVASLLARSGSSDTGSSIGEGGSSVRGEWTPNPPPRTPAEVEGVRASPRRIHTLP